MSLATMYGGWRGHEEAKGDQKRQEDELRAWLEQIQGISTPDPTDMEVSPEDYGYLGDFNPELEALKQQGDSEFSGISLDPATRDAQMQALASFGDIANSGGLSDLDKAQLSQAQRQVGRQMQGARQAIDQNMQQRGMSGSGMELMNKLMAQQAGAEQANMAAMQQAAQAQQGRMAALQGMGNLGGSIRAQDYGIAADRAAAQDAINRFNTANSQAVNQRNTAAQNTAGLRNLDTRQSMANASTDNRNAAQAYNKGLKQQDFENKMNKGMAQGAARGAMSDLYGKKADDTQRRWAGMGASHDQQHNNRAGTLAQMFGGMFGG